MKTNLKRFNLISLSLLLTLLSGCSLFQPNNTFQSSSFKELQGWNQQQAIGLRGALQESCKVYVKRTGPISADIRFGTYKQWQNICNALDTPEDEALTRFFENELTVYQVAPWENGLFTGYFTPLIYGSQTYSDQFSVPLLEVPDDLIVFNPEDFELERVDTTQPHRMKSGKNRNGWLVPYDDREEINKRADNGDYEGEVLFWLEDRVDRFFLQIQGSGTVRLDTGENVDVRISGRNGHEYFAIGRYLKRNKLLDKVSMQSIRQWLEDNPDRMDEVLYTNPDFIFFSKLGKPGPIGAQGSKLIPEHSAAVDDRVIPLGTPLWLSTTLTATDKSFARAMVAQDVGSAIRGNARADIFFGAGDEAAQKAGFQNAGGSLYVLLPRQVTE